MAYEYLKPLFGVNSAGQPCSLTFEQLTAAIDADKKMQLVDLSAGGYVAQHIYDAQKAELDGVRQQLTDANDTIKSYKDMKPDELKASVAEWEAKYNADTQALKDQMAALNRTHAEDKLLSGYKFTSKAAKNGIAAELKSKGFQMNEDGTLVGGADWLKSLTTNDEYKGAFVVTEEKKEAPPAGPLPRFSAPAGNSGANGNSNNPFGNMGFSFVNQPKK